MPTDKDINAMAKETIDKAVATNDVVQAAVHAAEQELAKGGVAIGASSADITSLVAELGNVADLNAVDAVALLVQARPLCDKTSATRDAVIRLTQQLLGLLGNGISLRQLVKDLHVKAAEVETAKANAEDVFGDLTGIHGALPTVPTAGKKSKK